MNSSEFLTNSNNLINSLIEYLESLKIKKIIPKTAPDEVINDLPTEMPFKGEDFNKIIDDFNTKVMTGVVHWSHPRFFGYLPSSHAFPSILADMFISKLGAMAFAWISGPSMTELEFAMADWIGRSFGLPPIFFNGEPSSVGGGVFAASATECVVMAVVAARQRAIHALRTNEVHDAQIASKLVAYCSNETHSCLKKATRIASVRLRVLEADNNQMLSPSVLEAAMFEDSRKGYHPCFVNITLGTYSSGAFDNLKELAPIAKQYPLCWIHVNGAFGGNNFICPELRYHMEGIEDANSFCVNTCKGILINADLTCLWVKNKKDFCSGLVVDPIYLQHNLADYYHDLRHWSLFLSRRCRALKVWYTYRIYGVEALQNHVRNMHRLAIKFKELVEQDKRFEICNRVETPLVCFRLKGSNETNYLLLAAINKSNRILLTPALLKEKFVLRLVVSHEYNNQSDIYFAWEVIVDSISRIEEMRVLESYTETYVRRLSYTKRISYLDYQRYNPKAVLRNSESPIFIATEDEISSNDEQLTK